MNEVLNGSIVSLAKDELNELLSEVKETVALHTEVKTNSFTTADLWNIHRKYKSAISTRSTIWN